MILFYFHVYFLCIPNNLEIYQVNFNLMHKTLACSLLKLKQFWAGFLRLNFFTFHFYRVFVLVVFCCIWYVIIVWMKCFLWHYVFFMVIYAKTFSFWIFYVIYIVLSKKLIGCYESCQGLFVLLNKYLYES